MASTYAEQIVGNLQNIFSIAVFHPPLAVLAVETELEVMTREVLPQRILDDRLEDLQIEFGHAVRSEVAVRDELFELAVNIGMKSFIKKLQHDGGNVRHEGTRAFSIDFVANTVSDAIEFVHKLSSATRAYTLYCQNEQCRTRSPWPSVTFSVSDVLNTTPGSRLLIRCPEQSCNKSLDEVKVPFRDESSFLHFGTGKADRSGRSWALQRIAGALEGVSRRQRECQEISATEYDRRLAFARNLVSSDQEESGV